MSIWNFVLSWVEHEKEKGFITSGPGDFWLSLYIVRKVLMYAFLDTFLSSKYTYV